MSVVSSVVLPAQPAIGEFKRQVLWGDGSAAPINYDDVFIQLTGDVSAGTNSMRIHTDARFDSIVAWAHLEKAGGAADWRYSLQLQTDLSEIQSYGLVADDGDVLGGVLAFPGVTWYPPSSIGTTDEISSVPLNDPMYVTSVVENLGAGETMSLYVRVYNFLKDARRNTPLSVLLASLPRASSVS